MIKLERLEHDGIHVPILNAQGLLDDTIMKSVATQKVKKKRGRPKKVPKVENQMGFNEIKFEESEIKDETYKPHQKIVKRKAKMKDAIKIKRPKLATKEKPKLNTKAKETRGDEAEVDIKPAENMPKLELKKTCSLCNGLELNQGKVKKYS